MRFGCGTWSAWAGVAGCALGLCAVGGCRGTAPEADPGAGGGSADALTAEVAAPAGLEVQIWAVSDDLGVVGGTLIGLGEEVARETTRSGFRLSGVEDWRSAGFRVVAIDPERVETLRASLRFEGPIQRRTLTSSPAWMVLAGGVRTEGGATRVGAGEERIDSGTGRMLARVWYEPEVGSGGVGVAMRVELMPQLAAGRVRGGADGVLGNVLSEGRVWRSLVLSVSADGSRALVVVPEAPEASWSVGAEGDAAGDVSGDDVSGGARAPAGPSFGTPEPADAGLVPEEGGEAGGSTGVGRAVPGPSRAPAATLAERLFGLDVSTGTASSSGEAVTRRVELVLVLVPRVPEGSASLLGPRR